MPVNMDPAKKRRRNQIEQTKNPPTDQDKVARTGAQFGDETEDDRIKALADAEKKNLWDATEVIDMDTF